MRDHTPNCEVRILGTRNCTCGAIDETYPTVTTNAVTDTDVLGPRDSEAVNEPALAKLKAKYAGIEGQDAPPPTSGKMERDAILRLLRTEESGYASQDNRDAATIARALRRIIDDIENGK